MQKELLHHFSTVHTLTTATSPSSLAGYVFTVSTFDLSTVAESLVNLNVSFHIVGK